MKLVVRLKRGIEAGLLAGTGVALFFTAMDVVRLAPLDTLASLAQAWFGLSFETSATGFDIAATLTTGAAVVLYLILHFGVFALLGVFATWFVPVASFWQTLARGAGFGAVVCSAAFYGSRAFTGSPFAVESLSAVSLLLINIMAGVIMAVAFAVHAADDEAAQVTV